jgi:NTP pyrophosphatase (non-canonical NTP hydrolase)
MSRARIFDDVTAERARQDVMKAAGRFRYTCADKEMTHDQRGLVLGEEVGEVCRAVLELSALANDAHGKNLRKELVQVAAVAVAWIEALDAEAPRG